MALHNSGRASHRCDRRRSGSVRAKRQLRSDSPTAVTTLRVSGGDSPSQDHARSFRKSVGIAAAEKSKLRMIKPIRLADLLEE